VDSLYREALELFKAGKIDDAITKLEGSNPAIRTDKIIRDEKRIADAQEELDVQKQALAKDKQDQIAIVRLLAEMYGLKFDLAKAEPQYDQLLRLDSTDLTILSDAADFYRQNHRYDNALRLLPKIIAHPQAEDWQKANAYVNAADMYTAIGQVDLALQACLAAQEAFAGLLYADSTNTGFKKGLAISYEKLGLAYTELGNLDTALTYFDEEIALFEALYSTYPQRMGIKKGLAIAYEKLGQTHAMLGNLDTALTAFKQYNHLVRELCSTYPQNVDFKNGLAISCEKLGMVYSALGNLDTALTYFVEETKIFEDLYKAYPQHVDIKKGLAIADEKLGESHTALGNLEKALTHFDQYNQLVAELCAAYPQNVDFKNGLAISCEKLGSTHAALGNLEKALTYFEEEIKLFEELCTAYPQHVSFKNGLAFSYAQLGQFYGDQKGDKAKARQYFERCQALWQELIKDNPRFVEFQGNLQQVQNALANLDKADDPVFRLNTRIQNEQDTLAQYQLYGILCDTLRQRVKNDPQYKARLADALNSRAWIGFFLKKFDTVEADIREGMALGTDNKYLVTNLAPALLLQGKYKAAVAEYKKWKDKPYGEESQSTYRKVFLDDLDAFEKAGIIPAARAADVAAVRKILLGA